MTRFGIDAVVALRIVRSEIHVADGHQLVGPSVLRSHALSALYRGVRAGLLDETAARQQLEGLAGLKVRLLGDRVSRATAWTIATRLGWDDTALAEYLAVAGLQADALVTDDPVLRAGAAGVVDVASVDALTS